MGLREHITGSRAHCAADGSTAPDATTGERGDGGAAGRADGAAAEGSLLGFIHARTAGEPEAQDQDCSKRTQAAAHVFNLHPTSFVPALKGTVVDLLGYDAHPPDPYVVKQACTALRHWCRMDRTSWLASEFS
jgi:hypothetical protein